MTARDILYEDLDAILHIEHSGIRVRFEIAAIDGDCAPAVELTRDEARALARDLLEMTR